MHNELLPMIKCSHLFFCIEVGTMWLSLCSWYGFIHLCNNWTQWQLYSPLLELTGPQSGWGLKVTKYTSYADAKQALALVYGVCVHTLLWCSNQSLHHSGRFGAEGWESCCLSVGMQCLFSSDVLSIIEKLCSCQVCGRSLGAHLSYWVKSGPRPSISAIFSQITSDWVIKFHGISWDIGQWGPYNPCKLCINSLYIGIIIFPHINNTQSTGHN